MKRSGHFNYPGVWLADKPGKEPPRDHSVSCIPRGPVQYSQEHYCLATGKDSSNMEQNIFSSVILASPSLPVFENYQYHGVYGAVEDASLPEGVSPAVEARKQKLDHQP